MTKRSLLLTLVVLFVAFSAQAQTFWRISGKNLSKPSYLFGTHHLIAKEDVKDFDKVLLIVGQTDAVVGEMDMTDKAKIQSSIMQQAIMPGNNIKQLLNDQDYALVDKEIKALLGAGLDQLGVMKPMMLTTLYTVSFYIKSQNITKQPEAIDELFQLKAKELNKTIIGLETPEQQGKILMDMLPLKRQAELLVKTIKEKEKGIDDIKRLNKAYIAGNLDEMAALNAEDDDMTKEERRPLFEDRNNNWMTLLPQLMSKQACFIAVGCLHLTGEEGLLAQLKKAGYTVQPVTF